MEALNLVRWRELSAGPPEADGPLLRSWRKSTTSLGARWIESCWRQRDTTGPMFKSGRGRDENRSSPDSP